jgi:hypothetical protein
VSDFASVYGIRLARGDYLSWREFRSLLVGLMSCDSRLSRHFANLEPDDE